MTTTPEPFQECNVSDPTVVREVSLAFIRVMVRFWFCLYFILDSIWTEPKTSPPSVSVIVFCTDNKQGLQDHTFLVLSWTHEQEHQGFILVQTPHDEVIVLRTTVCY
jgi:hypothetical protein